MDCVNPVTFVSISEPPPVIKQPYHPAGPRNQFNTAIKKVFKLINQNEFASKMSLSKTSVRVLNDLIVDSFQRLLLDTQMLMSHENQHIMTSRTLDQAVRMFINSPIGENCLFYGRKAVCDYFHNDQS